MSRSVAMLMLGDTYVSDQPLTTVPHYQLHQNITISPIMQYITSYTSLVFCAVRFGLQQEHTEIIYAASNFLSFINDRLLAKHYKVKERMNTVSLLYIRT